MALASPAWAASLTVTTDADSGAGSLRQAIIDANATTGVADTINFDLGSAATITLTSAQLPRITDVAGLTIDGGSANITISGDNKYRVFEVFHPGGAIGNAAKLTLSNLTVADGYAPGVGGDGNGGAIHNSGTLEVSNSTLSGNSASSATPSLPAVGNGGGIYNSPLGSVTFKNTIVANNTSDSGGDCSGSNNDGGYNLDSGTSCGFPTQNSSKDPLLGTLADNGGPTKTHALLAGSPAIDKGNSFGATTDQRGLPRPSNFVGIVNAADGSDIGAFELQAPPTTRPKVTSTVPTSTGTTPATGVAPTINVKATFSEDMLRSSITGQTFKLFKKGTTTKKAATVSYNADTDTAKLARPTT